MWMSFLYKDYHNQLLYSNPAHPPLSYFGYMSIYAPKPVVSLNGGKYTRSSSLEFCKENNLCHF